MILLTRILPTQSSFVAQCVEDLNVNVDVWRLFLWDHFLLGFLHLLELLHKDTNVRAVVPG